MKSIIISSLFFSIIATSLYAAGAAGSVGSATGSQYQSDYTNPYNYPSSSFYYNSNLEPQGTAGMPQGYYNPHPTQPWQNSPNNVQTNPNYQTNPQYQTNPTYPETQPYYYYQGSRGYPNASQQTQQQDTILNSKTSFNNPGMNSSSYSGQRRSGIDSPSQQYNQNYYYQNQGSPGSQAYYYQNSNAQQGYYPENLNRQDIFERQEDADPRNRSYYRSLRND